MKSLLIALVMIGVIGGITYFSLLLDKPVQYAAERVVTETVEVTPDWAEDPDAVQAAQDVIRKKELEAELKNLEAEVAEREARIEAIERELSL